MRLAGLICALLLAGPATAQDCRLALLLGLDTSASVDAREHAIQRDGLAAALLSPSVEDPILNGPGPVAIGVFEWSGRFQQQMISPWRLIQSRDDLQAIANDLAQAPRSEGDFPTAIGYAIGFAAEQFEQAPPCLFQTLDIAGDGQNNDGFTPSQAYAHFGFEGITVNGLAIGGASRLIGDYYEAEVISGPGAFVVEAFNHDDFEDAMRRKLERELNVFILGQLDP